jgi:hypothetical protein
MSLRLAAAAFLVAAFCGISGAQLETRAFLPLFKNSAPYAIAVGDFNGDGRLDAAVVMAVDINNVAILLGNGDGTFQPPLYYVAGGGPTSIAVADLRHIGKLDLVVGDTQTDDVYVMLGNGDGTFQQAVPYPTLGRPFAAGIGDFNNDGKPDIWALTDDSSECGCIEVLLGNGDGTFQSPIGTREKLLSSAAATGDFDHDGNLDLAISQTFGGSQLAILLGNGDGTFRRGATYPTADSGTIAVGKFVTGSKDLDLALAEPEGGEIAIFLGNGNGTFRQGQIIPGDFPAGITLADLNGDGKTDLLVGSGFTSNYLTTYLGNGDGTFQAGVSYPLGNETASQASGDFNGDHKTDVVVTDYLGDAVITLLNTGVVTFSPTTPLSFAKQAAGTTSAPQTVTLTNTGQTALTIAAVAVKGQFAMTSTCGSTVAPGRSCAIDVTFSPQSKGAKSGTVSIHDNASSKPQVIALSGIGT